MKKIIGFAMLLLVAPLADAAFAQAWVPGEGEGTVSVLYQGANSLYHYKPTAKVDLGRIDSHALVLDTTYGLTDKIAVDVALPFVVSKYTGTQPHPTSLDDGNYHGTIQDVRLDLRYNMTRRRRMAFTPFVGTVMPSHDYEYYAHSAPGRRLRELQVGAYAAKLLDPILPGVFVQARYGYGFVERVLDISHNRSMADLEVGYFFTPSIRSFALLNGQYTHGGIDLPAVGVLPPDIRPFHDQIDRVHFLNVGAGTAVSLTDKVDLFASALHNVAGRNGHALNLGVNAGLTWSFTRSAQRASTVAQAHARSLVKCLCQKGD
jgi:hypothetical protein